MPIVTTTDLIDIPTLKSAKELATKYVVDKIVHWNANDKKIRDYLTRFIDVSMCVEIRAITSAREMRTRLESRFTENSGAHETYL